MDTSQGEKYKEIYNLLSQSERSKRFGLRDGYLYAYVIKKIKFELFIASEYISLKYPLPNISNEKISILSQLILDIDINFTYTPYNTTAKNQYSSWKLSTASLSAAQIVKLILNIENKTLIDI